MTKEMKAECRVARILTFITMMALILGAAMALHVANDLGFIR